MRVIPFEPWHLTALERQPIQAAGDDEPDAAELARGPAWTVLGADRLPVGCAGFTLSQWPGQAVAWSILGDRIGATMVGFTRRVRLEFERSGLHRIEALIQAGHAEGHRWAALCGMTHEGTLRRWGPRQVDMDVYARVKL